MAVITYVDIVANPDAWRKMLLLILVVNFDDKSSPHCDVVAYIDELTSVQLYKSSKEACVATRVELILDPFGVDAPHDATGQ